MSQNLQRFTTPGEDGQRVYTDGEDLFLPSVTTVLDEQPTPIGIKIWKQNSSGNPDDYDEIRKCWKCDGSTKHAYKELAELSRDTIHGGLWKCTECGETDYRHWKDILQYKSNRGTMIHYRLLNEFEDGDMFGQNEEDSTEQLKLEGDWERYRSDLSFAEDAWREVKEIRGINKEQVLDVECFVTNVGIGYAGQFDLLYVDNDGNLTLSDLKTGKGIYDKYKLQLVAYDNALELPIDRLEIIRINPDTETWEVSANTDWKESRKELWADFMELRMGMGNVEEEFRQVASEGINDTE